MIPKLRTNLQIMPAMTMEGEQVVIIQDPLGLLPNPIMMPPEMMGILQLIEQAESIEELQVTLTRLQGGSLITKEEIERIFQELDEQYLLDSERYRQAYQKLIQSFQQESLRKLAHRGVSYPEDPEKLKEEIEKALKKAEVSSPFEKLVGLVAPHIDLRVGMDTYGAAYKILQGMSPPKVVFLFGVGHQMDEGFFCPTTKDFETPFGVVKNAREFSERLIQLDTPGRTPHDFFHKGEHSIEFQLLFLHHLFGDTFEIVPILWGSLYHYLKSCSRPLEVEPIQGVIEELRRMREEIKEEALFIAGVDLAHVGLKFGDPDPAATILLESEPHDKKLLQALEKGDVEEFWKINQEVEDRYHVCGFTTLSVLLEVLSPIQGRTLRYDIWEEEVTQSAVSFAAVALGESNEL